MKVIHIEARLKDVVRLPDSFINMLPKRIVFFTTIQFMNSMNSILKQIVDSGREVMVFKTSHTRHKGQILGCNIQNFEEYAENKDFDAFVYVGDGLFHPKALIWENTEKTVYSFNPFNNEQKVLDKKDILLIKRKHDAALSKFFMSNKIGVLITTKPGQLMLKRALELRKEYPEKEFFFMIDNTINFESLEDFPFVECWVNTACPRIGFDDSIKISKPIVNLEEIKKINPKRALIR